MDGHDYDVPTGRPYWPWTCVVSRFRDGCARPLMEMVDEAADKSGNAQYWRGQPHIWDARDVHGTILDPDLPVLSLAARGHGDVYINMRPGVGA